MGGKYKQGKCKIKNKTPTPVDYFVVSHGISVPMHTSSLNYILWENCLLFISVSLLNIYLYWIAHSYAVTSLTQQEGHSLINGVDCYVKWTAIVHTGTLVVFPWSVRSKSYRRTQRWFQLLKPTVIPTQWKSRHFMLFRYSWGIHSNHYKMILNVRRLLKARYNGRKKKRELSYIFSLI